MQEEDPLTGNAEQIAFDPRQESKCARICTNVVVVLNIILLFGCASYALFRTFYWWNTKSPVAEPSESGTIGLAYFITALSAEYIFRQLCILLWIRTVLIRQ